MSKKVLFYYQPNKKSISLISQALILEKRGFQVYLLTVDPNGKLHQDMEKIHIANFSCPWRSKNSVLNYLFLSLYLIYFSYRYRIDFILAHLHVPCFTAGLAQFFILSKCIFFRHNSSLWNDEDLYKQDINPNERRLDKWINNLAKEIVVPSEGVKNYMITNEKVDKNRIQVLHYIYDFEFYPMPNKSKVREIQSKYKSSLLMVMISRMVKHKRHQVVFEAIHEMIKNGFDIKLMVLDSGPELKCLQQYVYKNSLQEHIIFIGYIDNPTDYMKAADILIQPSMTDASNSVSKEMGYLSKPVMVSDGVGDYSEYIIHGVNGILLPIHNTKNHITKEIRSIFEGGYNLEKLGIELKKTILEKFSKANLENEYKEFIDKNLV